MSNWRSNGLLSVLPVFRYLIGPGSSKSSHPKPHATPRRYQTRTIQNLSRHRTPPLPLSSLFRFLLSRFFSLPAGNRKGRLEREEGVRSAGAEIAETEGLGVTSGKKAGSVSPK